MENLDHQFTETAICPYCGHDNGDIAAEAAEYTGFNDWCEECGKEYSHILDFSYVYITKEVTNGKS